MKGKGPWRWARLWWKWRLLTKISPGPRVIFKLLFTWKGFCFLAIHHPLEGSTTGSTLPRPSHKTSQVQAYVSLLSSFLGSVLLTENVLLCIINEMRKYMVKWISTEKYLRDPTYAIFFKIWIEDVKYDIPMCQSHSTRPQPIQLVPTMRKKTLYVIISGEIPEN